MNAITTKPKQIFPTFIMALCGAVLTSGCCFQHGQIVVVPEAVYRTEKTLGDRIHPPLTAEGWQRVTNFLASGGNRKNKGGSPEADVKTEIQEAEPVMNLLATHKLTADDIKGKSVTEVTTYFGKKFTRQIVDARSYDERNVREEPKDGEEWGQYPPFPFAFRHGRFWWVFFPNDAGNITGLMLSAEIKREKPMN